MNSFYSSLVINSKRFPNVRQLLKPRYNKEYFKRVTANLAQLEALIEQRCRYHDPSLCPEKLKDLKANSGQLVKLKERLKKLNAEDDTYKETLERLEGIEEQLMPTIVSIPNRTSKLVPAQDAIVEEVKSDFQARENLVKILNYKKLSYINNCYSKSVVGPNSHYYYGIGAKLQQALTSYFMNHLERENFIPVSGLCLTKSPFVEAVNSKDGKEYFNDPARIIGDNVEYTTLHLNESSRESLVGFITTLAPIVSNDPLRVMTSGSSYRLGSDWYDGDDKRITQTETVHALTLNSSIEQYSLLEYIKVRDIIWSCYKRLELPLRLVHCSTDSMLMNEFDAHRVDIWLPSRQEWLQVGRISHYRDHITTRVGMKRGHIIDSMVYDGQALFAAIIENRQTATGKFIIPIVLNEHLNYLTQTERAGYLKAPEAYNLSKAQVLTNHEQRRFLVKKNYLFGHSKKSHDRRKSRSSHLSKLATASLTAVICILMDWDTIWCDYLPDWMRALLYDYVRLPARHLWFSIICDKKNIPVDKPYAEINKTRYAKTRAQREHEKVSLYRNRLQARKEN